MKKKYIMFFLIIIFLIICILFKLITNKTFFKTKYIGVDSQEIFIPKYSYFKEECCMTAAIFYSLKSENELKQEIYKYMKDFEYFEDETTYGYKKGNLFIQKYDVEDKWFFRKIIITY